MRETASPPYCGVRLSHQCAATVVVVVVTEVVADVDVAVEVVEDVVTEVVVVLVVDVVPDVVADVLQDAKTSDVTMIQVSITQITPLFMYASFLYLHNSR
jgi:hypothetical protein